MTAETLWSDQAKWNERVEQYAVKELLDLKNDTWLGDDESERCPPGHRRRRAAGGPETTAGELHPVAIPILATTIVVDRWTRPVDKSIACYMV